MLYWLLPYTNMNQPLVYICPLPLEPPTYAGPLPTLLDCHRAPGCLVPYSVIIAYEFDTLEKLQRNHLDSLVFENFLISFPGIGRFRL